MTDQTVEADNRGRVLLGKHTAGTRYRVTEHTDGTIVLEPARIVTETELALLGHPDIVAGLRAAKDGTFQGKRLDWER